jgi:hypothetical protein
MWQFAEGGFSKSAMVESLVQPWHQALNMSRLSKVKGMDMNYLYMTDSVE